ncbi:bacteriocin biosynthesis cyclodehydratase domain-containing protein [Ancylomarina subtilis]|uniref:Bacteriocin biosynthesis cyclodehydratase domain-containing protein n=1 Tax=Ancylomarina subtilis TaxID=1639035 RepID=A0A4Q7VLF0_9BACT|nr:TOMM precursor leader peptide-binding protein [Ancylomarina subtilis]RZT97059.1 bacteriocin biosynthesis cyclodehydratase domain-containing protein [Ancylomarina subtilis]
MIDKFDVFKDEANNCFQLRTKSNAYALEFDDIEKEAIFLKIVKSIQGNPSISLKQIRGLFEKNTDPKVTEVLNTLNDYGFLPIPTSMELVGKNNNEQTTNSSYNALEKIDIGIIGEGPLFEILSKRANSIHFSKIEKKNYSELKNTEDIEKLIHSVDFIIVDANQWSPFHLELINKIALKNEKPWLYVGGLEEISLKIGPLFYGKETGCYNCLISRLKSNHEYPEMLTAYEGYLHERKIASKPDLFPSLEIIYGLISNLVFLEVAKFYESWSLPLTWRTVLSFDIMNYQMTQHSLLKKPFCEICKPELEYNPSPWLEAITLK